MNWFRRRLTLTAFILGLSLSVLALANCGGDENNPVDPNGDPPAGPDTTAPAAVTDLRLRTPTQNTMALAWTAPGDDGTGGTATSYDIRFSKAAITDANWDQATPLAPILVPTPKPGGQVETIVATGLNSGTTYYFALKTSDEVPNQSGLSNCCSEATLRETIPPSDITNLKAIAVDANSFELTWTAPGDDYNSGTATRYEIRYYFARTIDETSWEHATPVSDPPAPKPAGEIESLIISELPPGNYTFAIKAVDELDNWSGLSNNAYALGYNEVLWRLPSALAEGEEVTIIFRATDQGRTRISLHNPYGVQNCGERLVMDILWETLPAGMHTMKFDFVDPDTGNYLPGALYAMSLCYETYLQEWLYVSFDQ